MKDCYAECKLLYFTVVIYNINCTDSPSIQYALKHRSNVKIIVIDNSTIKTDNEKYCLLNSIIYHKMNGNEGLSKAYNQAIKLIGKLDGYVIWADDDTIFPDDFFEKIIETLNKDKPQVLLPLVYSNMFLYSPSTIDKYGIPKRCKKLEQINNNISGINSGMVVNLEIYKKIQYDENLFLDFIDHDFCSICNTTGIPITIERDVILYQNAFFDSQIDFKSTIIRRKIYRKDFIHFCSKHGISKHIAVKKLFNGEIEILLRFIRQIIRK